MAAIVRVALHENSERCPGHRQRTQHLWVFAVFSRCTTSLSQMCVKMAKRKVKAHNVRLHKNYRRAMTTRLLAAWHRTQNGGTLFGVARAYAAHNQPALRRIYAWSGIICNICPVRPTASSHIQMNEQKMNERIASEQQSIRAAAPIGCSKNIITLQIELRCICLLWAHPTRHHSRAPSFRSFLSFTEALPATIRQIGNVHCPGCAAYLLVVKCVSCWQ